MGNGGSVQASRGGSWRDMVACGHGGIMVTTEDVQRMAVSF